jgi:hypothetical protein
MIWKETVVAYPSVCLEMLRNLSVDSGHLDQYLIQVPSEYKLLY